MRRVDIFLEGQYIFVLSSVSTHEGIYVSDQPRIKLGIGDGILKLGNAVVECLDHPVSEVPYPDLNGRKALRKDLLNFLGAKSWGQFAKRAQLVDVSRTKDGKVKITPHHRGEQSAFFPESMRAVICPATAAEIGSAAFRLLSTNTTV